MSPRRIAAAIVLASALAPAAPALADPAYLPPFLDRAPAVGDRWVYAAFGFGGVDFGSVTVEVVEVEESLDGSRYLVEDQLEFLPTTPGAEVQPCPAQRVVPRSRRLDLARRPVGGRRALGRPAEAAPVSVSCGSVFQSDAASDTSAGPSRSSGGAGSTRRGWILGVSTWTPPGSAPRADTVSPDRVGNRRLYAQLRRRCIRAGSSGPTAPGCAGRSSPP